MPKQENLKTYELKLDFDIEDFSTVEDILCNRAPFVLREFSLSIKQVSVYRTPHGYHVIMVVEGPNRWGPRDICFIQLALGDDYKRAVFNWHRAREAIFTYGWNTLFSHHERYMAWHSKYLTKKLKRLLGRR